MSRLRNPFALATLLAALCVVHCADYQHNMFLNGVYQHGVAAETHHSVNPSTNMFLKHAIISRQASPFQGPTYLPPREYLKCGAGQQCVRQGVCQNGYFAQQQPRIQNCEPESHVCCTYRAPPTTPRPTTTTTTTTERPYATCGRDSDCVAPQECRNGEIITADYIKTQGSNRCYAPEVCCRMPSTTLTENGYIFNLPEKQFSIPTTTPRVYQPKPPAPAPVPVPVPTPAPVLPTKEYLPPQTTPRQVYRQPPTPPPTRPIVKEYLPPQTTARPVYRPTPPVYRPQPVPTTRRPTSEYLPPVSTNEIPVREQPDRVPQPSNQRPVYRGEDQLSPQIFPQQQSTNEIPKYFAKCASALVCSPENYCNSIGVLTTTPVEITPFRVPLTDCILPDSGAPGKCCRDPDYTDPWPFNQAGVCATRNRRTKPVGVKDLDANFGEIPWQAMILRESNKALVCGGAIVGDQMVLTSANCIKGIPLEDVRVKAGEWQLGNTNEPMPFQLVGVKSIDIHPQYNPSTGANDMAIIRLDKRLEFATHIQPICLSDQDPSDSEQCVTTGWGKQALSIHEEGAIMHVTDTSVLTRSDCGADASGVCSATKFDSCEFDVGSALACGSGSSVYLKGIYSVENGCGEGQTVRFTKPDVKWINTAFTEIRKPLLVNRI